jgi:RNA polymerase primary sigma factor
MVELIARWKEASQRLEEELGRPPTSQELAREMEVPLKKLHIVRRAIKAFHAPPQAPVTDDGESVDFADLFEDFRNGPPDEALAQSEEFHTIIKLIDAIDERDARILRLRFGLEGQEPLTLKQIGQQVGLTRERVRQIEVEALRKLQARLNDDRPSRFFRPEDRPDNGVPPPRRPRQPQAEADGARGRTARPDIAEGTRDSDP